MVSCEYFYLFVAFEHYVYYWVYVFWFLGFLTDLGKNCVPTDTLPHFQPILLLFILLFLLAFVADKARLKAVHEIVAMSQTDFLIFQLDPNNFLDQFVTPLLHDLKRGIELTIQNPQEDEALVWQQIQRNPSNLAVGHGVVFKWKFAIGKHKLRVILLSSFDSPGRVNQNHIEFAHLFREELPVEVPNIAVDVAIGGNFAKFFPAFIKNM